MRLCFYVIPSFLPSLPAGCRHGDSRGSRSQVTAAGVYTVAAPGPRPPCAYGLADCCNALKILKTKPKILGEDTLNDCKPRNLILESLSLRSSTHRQNALVVVLIVIPTRYSKVAALCSGRRRWGCQRRRTHSHSLIYSHPVLTASQVGSTRRATPRRTKKAISLARDSSLAPPGGAAPPAPRSGEGWQSTSPPPAILAMDGSR